MKISNINKPTSAFWSKVAVICAAASTFIAGYAYTAHIEWLMIAGGIFGMLGTVIPILVSNGEN